MDQCSSNYDYHTLKGFFVDNFQYIQPNHGLTTHDFVSQQSKCTIQLRRRNGFKYPSSLSIHKGQTERELNNGFHWKHQFGKLETYK